MASNHDSEDIPVYKNILIPGSAVWYGIGLLPMVCFPYILAIIGTRMVGGCVIFTEAQESGLDLTGFGNKFCHKGDNYIKAIVIWSKFWSINDLILQNWEACVDTAFGTCQDNQNGPIGSGEVVAMC